VSYREATFYFYTGTGNSYRVAAWMADIAREAGVAVTLRPIGSAHPGHEVGTGQTALLGLVMPTHGFTTPWAMLRFAVRLLPRRRTHAVVVATRAGSRIGPVFTPGIEGTATLIVALILALKGYHIRGATGIDMPSNWTAVHPGLAPDTVVGIGERARVRVAGFMGAILSGKRRFTGWIPLLIGLWLFHISLAYLLLGRLFLVKLFFASDRCTGCGLCAEYCPNSAIRMRGRGNRSRPYWTFHCESCMRCMAYCPTQAVEASHLLGVGVYLLAAAVPTATLLAWLVARAPALAWLSGTPSWLFESVYALVALGLGYPLFHFLLTIGWVNRLFTLATLTHYYRRYHEPKTQLKDLV
jgi:NAD-dependent dihydropyrimidine dehydrogenase PreA subunit